MKLTVIGAGNMGGALAIGLSRSGAVKPSDITVTARHETSLERFKAIGFNTSTDNASAVKGADIVFYAVKPWLMEEVIKGTKDSLDYGRQMLVSIAPGVSSENLKSWFAKDEGGSPAIAYVIPNTAIEIGESMTFIAPVTVSESQTTLLKLLFDHVGESIVVDVDHMLAGTSLASCGIAYAMRYISAASAGGNKLGLEGIDIEKAVCQTVKGAVELISSRGTDPEEEIDKVTTPNGLTLRGLNAMEDAGFSDSVIKGLTVNSSKKKRLVIKLGNSVLTRHDGSLDITRVSAIVDQIMEVKRDGYDIILVTSGAVACGRSTIAKDNKLTDAQQRQLYSTVGQVRLMDLYYRMFSDYGTYIGQILTMKNSFSTKVEYNNQLHCIEVMLQSNVIPIVNENDALSITELMFTDNDELSGLVAEMVGADTLILLTNVDGVYDGMPEEKDSKVIRTISPDDSLDDNISVIQSGSGPRSLASKCHTAKNAASKGIRTILANGRRDHILTDILRKPEDTVFTEFIPVTK